MSAVKNIQMRVCVHYGTDLTAMLGPCKHRDIAWPRQVAMYLVRKHTSASFPLIGRLFARDHSTVIHALDAVERRSNRYPVPAELEAYAAEQGKLYPLGDRK